MKLRFWEKKPIELVNENTENGKKSDSLNEELLKEPFDRIRESLKDWGDAVIDAENPFMPESIRYQNLLNIYRNIELDPHVSAITETIFNRVFQTSFQITKDGEKDEEKTALFQSSWFHNFVKYALDADYWGFSLIQITEVSNGVIKAIDNIDRFYIRPNAKGVAKSMWQDDIFVKYDEEPMKKWLLFIKSTTHLGRYNIIAKNFILKREVQQFWAVFNELFTTPYFVIKTNFNDKNHRNNLLNWVTQRKHSGAVVVGQDDEINAVSGAGNGYTSYKEFKDEANREMSKAFLGSTMVLDDGSSRSQAEVHNDNTESFIQSKRVWLENIINEELIPKLQGVGVDISTDYKFSWVISQKMSVSEWSTVISQLAQYFELDETEVTKKTGLTVEKKEQIPVVAQKKEKIENVLNKLYNASTHD